MKIAIDMEDFFKVFPQYENELNQIYQKYMDILEQSDFKISSIKDKNVKSIFNLQLGTKVDFGLKVKWSETLKDWELLNNDIQDLTVLRLRDDKIVLDWDTKTLESLNLEEYLKNSYQIEEVSIYENKNYIGEGSIDWDTITEDVKKNWDDSFFFLENMNDKQFVENNKKLILEKTQDNPEVLKEALKKSDVFFKYALQELPIEIVMTVMENSPKQLADIWTNRIRQIAHRSDYSLLIKEAKEQFKGEFDRFVEYTNDSNAYNSYPSDNDYKHYQSMQDRLEKDFEIRKKELKIVAQENKEKLNHINKLLENENLKINLVTGLLKGEMSKLDFIYFEDFIIQHNSLKEIVIQKGLYESNATTMKFVDSLNQEEFLKFAKICNDEVRKSIFSTSDKLHFTEIVSDEKILSLLKNNDDKDYKWVILDKFTTKNSELNKYLFQANPKERFEELPKSAITEEAVRIFLKADGYLNQVKSRVNIYQFKEIETIKEICGNHSHELNTKQIPKEWKRNPEIIRSILSNKKSVNRLELSADDVLELSKDIDLIYEVVSQDTSGSFYKLLPKQYKNNTKIALLQFECAEDYKSIIKSFSPLVLSNKNFNIKIIQKNPEVIKILNKDMWNDKQFVLTLFSEIEGTYTESRVKENLPEKIKFFLDTFNIKENLYTFFNNYYLQKKLESNLVNELPREKVKKIKI